jgi:hypothetical protein
MSITDYFAQKPIVTIVTTTRDGREIATPIWGVLVDGVPYVRNGYGETSAWYKRLRRNGRAAFLDGPTRQPVHTELVDDEATKHAVDDAYRAKYRGQGIALRQVVAAPARDYTLRVTLENGLARSSL